MSERAIRFTSAALALTGVAVTGYLLYVRSTGGTLACVTGGCDTVQHSSYSELFGVPVAALGLAGFLGLLAAALTPGEAARLTHGTLALVGFFFGLYLLVVQVVVIDAICQWCVASDLLTTAIAALALLRLRPGVAAELPPPPTARPYPQRRPNGSRGPSRTPRQQARTR
jgi:uncharacterized membrane protein